MSPVDSSTAFGAFGIGERRPVRSGRMQPSVYRGRDAPKNQESATCWPILRLTRECAREAIIRRQPSVTSLKPLVSPPTTRHWLFLLVALCHLQSRMPIDMPRNPTYTLLTGATGLVGSLLTRDFLCNGTRLAVLVRPSNRHTAAERIESMLQMWESRLGAQIPRPVCLEGDVTQSDLGLTKDAQRWLTQHCDRVIHSAAILEFVGPDREKDPWKTNLEGTRRTLGLCRKLGLRDFHYVSTAYVWRKASGIHPRNRAVDGAGFSKRLRTQQVSGGEACSRR